MSKLLKLLLGSALPMYVGEEGGGGTADDHDLDDDMDEDPPASGTGEDDKPKVGDQDDGSVVVELDEDAPKEGDGDVVLEEDNADREKIREARRKERTERKQRQKDKEESTKRELQAERTARKDLEQRLAAIEGKDKSRELAQLDEGLKRTSQAYNFQKDRLQQAHEQHDGAAAADATEKMLAARDNFTQLKNIRDGFEKSTKTPAALDERLVNHAQKFMGENNWYKPAGKDQDSSIVRAVDNALAEEGWDATTPEYWDELRSRVKKVLPHRVAGGKVATTDVSAPARTKVVVSGGSGDTQAPSSKGTFTLSRERVQALKEAGMWEDPKQREDAIKRFRAHDKQNKG